MSTNEWQTQVVTNVSSPSMLIFRPEPSLNNGTSVIVAPGGGLYAHGIKSEGIDLYSAWLKSGKNPAIHMYSRGGHGFGMNTQNLPSDTWIERFYDWAVAEQIVAPYP